MSTETLLIKDRCPLGNDPGALHCSASSCLTCIRNRVKSQEAMNAWLHTYAADHCDEAEVERYWAIILEHGTVAYIAEVNGTITAALEDGE